MLSQATKVVVVTGGASGIGAACSRLFAQHGAKVIVADIQQDRGSSLAKELGSQQALFVPCDVTKEADVAAAVQAAVDKFAEASVVQGVFHGIKHAARAMKGLGIGGSIINTSSIAGLAMTGNWASAGYAASKTGVVALTKLAACELASHGITVNAVAPGPTASPMIGGFLLGDVGAPDQAVEQAVASQSPVKGRACFARGVASAALFLASEAGQAVNGHILVVDLGVTAGVTGQVPPMSQLPSQFFDEQGRADGSKFAGIANLGPTP
ncbi:hypothetical protein N2152v2_007258 [Parachlorella kessleri]